MREKCQLLGHGTLCHCAGQSRVGYCHQISIAALHLFLFIFLIGKKLKNIAFAYNSSMVNGNVCVHDEQACLL